MNGGGSNPGVNNFRIDPHEFSAATAFAYRRVKLAAFERAGACYAIGWSFSNPSALSTTLRLVADLDRQGCDGITIATGLDPAAGLRLDHPRGLRRRRGAVRLRAGAVRGHGHQPGYSRWPIVRQVGYAGPLPRLVPARGSLRFGAANNAGTLTALTPAQQVVVTKVGAGTANWTATSDQPWVQVTPGSASGTAVLTVGLVNPGSMLPATGPPRDDHDRRRRDRQLASVHRRGLVVKAPGPRPRRSGPSTRRRTAPRASPGPYPLRAGRSTTSASKRSSSTATRCLGDPSAPNGKVYIGDANLVAGARPDVEAVYAATMPRAYLAGWGYMLLTNFLPNLPERGRRNGTFTLYALRDRLRRPDDAARLQDDHL